MGIQIANKIYTQKIILKIKKCSQTAIRKDRNKTF